MLSLVSFMRNGSHAYERSLHIQFTQITINPTITLMIGRIILSSKYHNLISLEFYFLKNFNTKRDFYTCFQTVYVYSDVLLDINGDGTLWISGILVLIFWKNRIIGVRY